MKNNLELNTQHRVFWQTRLTARGQSKVMVERRVVVGHCIVEDYCHVIPKICKSVIIYRISDGLAFLHQHGHHLVSI